MTNRSESCFALVLVCLFATMVSSGSGYAIDQSTSSESNEAEAGALQTLADFRNKLAKNNDQQQSVAEEPTVTSTIDELDVLQMLPKVISHMRRDTLTAKERGSFKWFFGSIWELIVEESRRHRGQPRNPILTALLASPEIRHGQQDIRDELGNDVVHNSVSKVYQAGSSAKAIVFDEQELPQRVLRMAAAIVQKYYQRKAKAGPASRRKAVQARRHQQRLRKMAAAHAKQLSEADSVRVTIEVPRFKRANQLAASLAGQDEADEEIEAKIMAAIQAQIGNPSLEEDDEEDEEAEEPAHHEDDSSEYLDDEADYMGILGDEDDDDDDDDDDDEEDIAADLLKAHAHNFENPSFNELLLLAARHRVTQQQKELELQHLAFRKTFSKAPSSSSGSSSYEDY